MKYDYKAVEAKWQKVWEDEKTFHVEIDHKKPKFYALVEFPYPSGAGLHVGHPRSYTALDTLALACVAAASALPRPQWAGGILVFGTGFVLPFFFSNNPAGSYAP